LSTKILQAIPRFEATEEVCTRIFSSATLYVLLATVLEDAVCLTQLEPWLTLNIEA
jgi:hypothetical protein